MSWNHNKKWESKQLGTRIKNENWNELKFELKNEIEISCSLGFLNWIRNLLMCLLYFIIIEPEDF